MAKSRDKGRREEKKKKKEKQPKGAPPPFGGSGTTGFTPRREPGMPGSAGAPPE
jgi:hypothetical protein